MSVCGRDTSRKTLCSNYLLNADVVPPPIKWTLPPNDTEVFRAFPDQGLAEALRIQFEFEAFLAKSHCIGTEAGKPFARRWQIYAACCQ